MLSNLRFFFRRQTSMLNAQIFKAVLCVSFCGLTLGFTTLSGLSPKLFYSQQRRKGLGGELRCVPSSRAYRTSLTALSDSERVVLTGLGVVSGCGSEIPKFWDNVKGGKSSVKRIER